MNFALQKLIKFFKLEIEKGFDNRAIIGGLERMLPVWVDEARNNQISQDLIIEIEKEIHRYGLENVSGRKQIIESLLQKVTENDVNIPQVPNREKISNPISSPNISVVSVSQKKTEKPLAQSKSNNRSLRPDLEKSVVGLNAPLTVISGIGKSKAETLHSLGLETLADVLYYFPRRYDDYSQLKPINRVLFGEEITIIGMVQSINIRPIRDGKRKIVEAVISDGTGFLRLTWFNQEFIARQINDGSQIVVSGKVEIYLGRFVMNNPDWEHIESEHLHTNRIVPIYSLTADVSQKNLRRLIYETVMHWSHRIPDHLPQEIIEKAQVISLQDAIKEAHFPDSQDALLKAQNRLAFDEILLLQLGVQQQKRNWQTNPAKSFVVDDKWINDEINTLPFQLTNAQIQVVGAIREDLSSGKPMNRLLQGDVGSGKTIVAALAISIIVSIGGQSAFMAPTSILAEQHFQTLQKIMTSQERPHPIKSEEIVLLVGSTAEDDKKRIRSGLLDGTIKVVIGTHALLEEPVKFKDLQFAIIDEQHRFGVEQRALLRAKGQSPHLLVMTATPIPRSLALTIYGDLDVSVMDEMPLGRIPVETFVLMPIERERAYNLISKQISEGHQAFIIYPLIQQNEEIDLKAAIEESERLQKEIFPKIKIGLLHGKMKADEKETVMTQFRNNELQILVSTSVIEVGVDIPNATVMLIEGADRFGLAQLHQFRGRVGRGGNKSFCLLIPNVDDAIENQRLTVMTQTNDGFILAEKDLELRGPGDFLGDRQSGFMNLKMAKLTDIHLIEKARTFAQQIFGIDPDLSSFEHALLRESLTRFWQQGTGDIS